MHLNLLIVVYALMTVAAAERPQELAAFCLKHEENILELPRGITLAPSSRSLPEYPLRVLIIETDDAKNAYWGAPSSVETFYDYDFAQCFERCDYDEAYEIIKDQEPKNRVVNTFLDIPISYEFGKTGTYCVYIANDARTPVIGKFLVLPYVGKASEFKNAMQRNIYFYVSRVDLLIGYSIVLLLGRKAHSRKSSFEAGSIAVASHYTMWKGVGFVHIALLGIIVAELVTSNSFSLFLQFIRCPVNDFTTVLSYSFFLVKGFLVRILEFALIQGFGTLYPKVNLNLLIRDKRSKLAMLLIAIFPNELKQTYPVSVILLSKLGINPESISGYLLLFLRILSVLRCLIIFIQLRRTKQLVSQHSDKKVVDSFSTVFHLTIAYPLLCEVSEFQARLLFVYVWYYAGRATAQSIDQCTHSSSNNNKIQTEIEEQEQKEK